MWSSTNYVGLNKDSSSEMTLQSIGQYIESYLDLVENVPNEIVRQVTKLHEHNHRFHQLLEKLEALDAALREDPSSSKRSKRSTLLSIQKYLIDIQAISDEKLYIVQSICEQLECKARQLDLDYRTVTAGSGASNIVSPIKGREYSRESVYMSYAAGNSGLVQGSFANVPGPEEPFVEKLKASQENSNDAAPPLSGSNADPEETDDCDMDSAIPAQPATSQKPNNGYPSVHSSPSKRGGRGRGGHHGARAAKERDVEATPSTSGRARGGKRGAAKAAGKDMSGSKRGRGHRDASSPPPSLYEENPIDPDEPTYCVCDQISFGEMICCDNSACVLEWFHFQCVQLTTKPKGKWYCPACRGDRSNVPKK